MSDFPRWDLVLFDLDGTLLDYHAAADRAFKHTFGHFGVDCEQRYYERFQEINAELWGKFEVGLITADELRVLRYRRLCEDFMLPFEPQAFSQRYLELLSQGGDLLPGAIETVRVLHGRVALGVITNGFVDVQTGRIEASGLSRYFEQMACSECAGAAKPQAPIFELAMQQHGLTDPSRVVIVGDNFNSDIRGGAEFGMATCWFNPRHNERKVGVTPTWEIDELSQLPGLLAR